MLIAIELLTYDALSLTLKIINIYSRLICRFAHFQNGIHYILLMSFYVFIYLFFLASLHKILSSNFVVMIS